MYESFNVEMACQLPPCIGVDSMGAMGALAPTAKKFGGDAPKSPHENSISIF